MNILLVEDDFVTRFIIKRMCEQLGHDCVDIEDGERCLEELKHKASDYAVVILDIHMPRLSGVDVVSELRHSDNDALKAIPVVAVTADDNWKNPRRCVENGFNAVIAKPVTLNGLAKTLTPYRGGA
jgi:CheY-like chemotaxis protein